MIRLMSHNDCFVACTVLDNHPPSKLNGRPLFITPSKALDTISEHCIVSTCFVPLDLFSPHVRQMEFQPSLEAITLGKSVESKTVMHWYFIDCYS